MPDIDTVVKWFALFGFPLAVISFVWLVWTHYRSHKENVRGTLSIGGKVLGPGLTVFGLFLDIWNNGEVPVYIKSVALAWKGQDSQGHDTTTQLMFKPCPEKRGPLQPGEGRSFILPDSPPHFLEAPSKQPEDNLWVSVQSPKGEVLRLKGDEVRPLLVELVKRPREKHQSK